MSIYKKKKFSGKKRKTGRKKRLNYKKYTKKNIRGGVVEVDVKKYKYQIGDQVLFEKDRKKKNPTIYKIVHTVEERYGSPKYLYIHP